VPPFVGQVLARLKQLRTVARLSPEQLEKKLILGPGWIARFEATVSRGPTQPSNITISCCSGFAPKISRSGVESGPVSLLIFIEEGWVDLECLSGPEAQFELFQHAGELFTVNKFDWRCTVADGFLSSIGCKRPRRKNDGPQRIFDRGDCRLIQIGSPRGVRLS
jgi:hypothetical protein